MRRGCSVPGCNSNSQTDIEKCGPVPVHKFPNDPCMQKKWLEAIKADSNFKLTINSRVCQKHFNYDDFKYYKYYTGRKTEVVLKHPALKKTAIPSLDNYCTIENQPKPKAIEKTQTTTSTILSNTPKMYPLQVCSPEIETNYRDFIKNYKKFNQSFIKKLRMNNRIHWQHLISGKIDSILLNL